jgi:hypothetical protein
MNRSFIFVASSVLGLSTLAVSRDAHALGPVDLEAGAKVGYATSPVSGGGTNPLGFGVGGRAGLAFLGGIYLGGNIMYYLGGSTNVPAPNGGVVTSAGSVSVSTNTLMYGGELGYGIKILDLLTIRPQVGLGNATFSVSGGGQSASSSYYYLEPGVTGLIGLGLLYVGADANVLVLPSLPSSQAAFTLHAQIGVKF